MKKLVLLGVSGLFIFFLFTPQVFCHCEIPCGIYGDEMRIEMIGEHITTIEKAIKKIKELSKEKDKNYNQIVRWVTSKDKHADEIQEIVSQYFMTQRIKPVENKTKAGYAQYVESITVLHKMLIGAMKTKQSTDPAHVEKLKSLLNDFSSAYLGKGSK
jgi:nickel superoxide dismutase